MSRPQGKKRSATTTDLPRDASSASTPTSSHHTAKKTRFVDPDDDPTNFAEQVDSALEGPSRRRAVKTEGYESDSSDDGEGVVYSRRKGDGMEDDLEGGEDDMFAAAEKAAPSGPTGSGPNGFERKGEDKFMRLGDIEGQEFDGDGSEGDDEDLEEDEPEDEDDAERRKKAGMGYELSSFNMREEMEEGKFTADGTEKEIKLARKRKKQQEKAQKKKQEDEERELRESGGKDTMELQLLPYLKKGETVLEALQRLGAEAKKKQAKAKKNLKPNAMPIDASQDKPPPTDIELITHLASNLMSLGDTDIYSRTYEEILRDVRRSGLVSQNWEPPSADVKYEYKWDVPGTADSQLFGPFLEEEMRSWFKASYFGQAGEKVKIRVEGGEWTTWDELLG